jgi:hypothetical protein
MTTAKKTKKSHEATATHATNEGGLTMKTGTKSNKSHEATATHATKGDQTMKTTKNQHATNANHLTNEGETNMKTKATESASTILTNPATPNATVVTTSPSVAGSLAYIQSCTTLMDQLEAAFPPGSALTAKDKKHKPKARKGGERYTPQLVALARQHGVNLKLVPLDEIANASAEATALVALQKRIEALSTRASSRMFTLQSATWSGSSKLYTVMKRLSKDDGEIATGLAPIEQFFNHRHPSVAADHPKTKKGKAAKAAEEAAAKAVTTEPVVAPVAAPVVAPARAPVAAPVVAPVDTPVEAPVTAATHS